MCACWQTVPWSVSLRISIIWTIAMSCRSIKQWRLEKFSVFITPTEPILSALSAKIENSKITKFILVFQTVSCWFACIFVLFFLRSNWINQLNCLSKSFQKKRFLKRKKREKRGLRLNEFFVKKTTLKNTANCSNEWMRLKYEEIH